MPKARVRQPAVSAEEALTLRQELQSRAVERFNHRTVRNDWDELMRELFERVVDGCPFAVGLFTRDVGPESRRYREMLNYNGGKTETVDYVLHHFKLGHYEHIAGSLEGLEPHERYDLYKIVSPGLGLPLNSLVYKIEHFFNPDLKAIVVFGGERLGGQMEAHLKMTTGLLERPAKSLAAQLALTPEESRYGEMIAALRAADPRKLRQSGLSRQGFAKIREIVTALGGMQDRFPQVLQAKFALLSRIVEDYPAAAKSSGPRNEE
ncbi:MAG: hypothetical protein ACHQZQ_08625 [SAR324 cluster bacterium]